MSTTDQYDYSSKPFFFKPDEFPTIGYEKLIEAIETSLDIAVKEKIIPEDSYSMVYFYLYPTSEYLIPVLNFFSTRLFLGDKAGVHNPHNFFPVQINIGKEGAVEPTKETLQKLNLYRNPEMACIGYEVVQMVPGSGICESDSPFHKLVDELNNSMNQSFIRDEDGSLLKIAPFNPHPIAIIKETINRILESNPPQKRPAVPMEEFIKNTILNESKRLKDSG